LPPTIYDIADRADVSTATVSRVLNEEPGVAPDTRNRVLEVAEEVGYHLHASAQNLARQRTDTIAVVVPVLANYFYMGVLRGIQDALAATEYNLLVYTPSHPNDMEEQVQRATQRGRSDALLLLSGQLDSDVLSHLETATQEVVLVDMRHPDYESIFVDNERGGYKATRHLIDLGYERIAHLTAGHPAPPPARERQKGYERALAEADGAVSGPIIARRGKEPFAFAKEGGYQAMKDLLGRDVLPDAVFAASDMQALGALRAISEAGYRVPQDIALIGFDDVEVSQYVGLSTLRQPLRDFGTLAVEKVIGRLRDPDRAVSSTMFDPELVPRQTCGAPEEDRVEGWKDGLLRIG